MRNTAFEFVIVSPMLYFDTSEKEGLTRHFGFVADSDLSLSPVLFVITVAHSHASDLNQSVLY